MKRIYSSLLLFFIFILLFSSISAYELQFYHNDHLGSPAAITNQAGEVVWKTDYRAFGESVNEVGNNKLKYNAKEEDATGLIYYGARYYNPKIGRFITADTVKGSLIDTQSQNRYVYVKNNPLKYVDLKGRQARSAILVFTDPSVNLDTLSLNSGIKDNYNAYVDTVLTPSQYFIALQEGSEKLGGKFNLYVGFKQSDLVIEEYLSSASLVPLYLFDYFSDFFGNEVQEVPQGECSTGICPTLIDIEFTAEQVLDFNWETLLTEEGEIDLFGYEPLEQKDFEHINEGGRTFWYALKKGTPKF